jgi:hypothetical protein
MTTMSAQCCPLLGFMMRQCPGPMTFIWCPANAFLAWSCLFFIQVCPSIITFHSRVA